MSTIRSSINIAMNMAPFAFFEGKSLALRPPHLTQYALEHGDPGLRMSYRKQFEPSANTKPFLEELSLVVPATEHVTEDQLRGMLMDLAFILLRRRGFDPYEVFGNVRSSVINLQPFSRMASTGFKYDHAFGAYVDMVTENFCIEGDNRFLLRVVTRQ